MASHFQLLDQKIPFNKKTRQWHIDHVKNYVAFDVKKTISVRQQQQIKCWKYYLCQIDKDQEAANKAITHPYFHSLGMEYISYPLIESKIDGMIGEYMTRYIQKHVYVLNKEAKNKKLDHIWTVLCESILREANKDLSQTVGFEIPTPNPEVDVPEDIDAWIENNGYKTETEILSNKLLDLILIAKKQKDKLKDLLLEFLVTDDCIALVTEEDGHPAINNMSIMETDLDWEPKREIQRKPQYIAFNKWLSWNNIVNQYNLTDDELDGVKRYAGIDPSGNNVISDGYDGTDLYSNWIKKDNEGLFIRCTELWWMSKKKVQAKVSINKHTGKEIYKLVADDYNAKGNEKLVSRWIDEPRKCVMIGPDVVLEYGEMEERYFRQDHPETAYFPIVALRRNNHVNSSQIRSAAMKLVQLQDFASEALFELRLAMRRNNGRVLVYDAAQVPKHFLKTGSYQNAINRVMHHAKKDQFLIINSQDKQSRYAFNQFTSLDLSTRGYMQDMFNMLAMIEDLAGKFLGISPQREGQVGQYETASGTERAVAQSNVRTEIYMKPFDSLIQALLEVVLMKGQFLYKENENIEYFLGDLHAKFLKVIPDFFGDDFGVYIGDSYKEAKRKQTFDTAAEQALATQQTPEMILLLTQALNAEYSAEAEIILKKGFAAIEALKKQNQEAEAANAKEIAAATDRKTQTDTQLKREGFQNNVDVAKIYAENKSATDAMKNSLQERISVRQIEKDLALAEKKNKIGSSN